jgi:hypothetical protein
MYIFNFVFNKFENIIKPRKTLEFCQKYTVKMAGAGDVTGAGAGAGA